MSRNGTESPSLWVTPRKPRSYFALSTHFCKWPSLMFMALTVFSPGTLISAAHPLHFPVFPKLHPAQVNTNRYFSLPRSETPWMLTFIPCRHSNICPSIFLFAN